MRLRPCERSAEYSVSASIDSARWTTGARRAASAVHGTTPSSVQSTLTTAGSGSTDARRRPSEQPVELPDADGSQHVASVHVAAADFDTDGAAIPHEHALDRRVPVRS